MKNGKSESCSAKPLDELEEEEEEQPRALENDFDTEQPMVYKISN